MAKSEHARIHINGNVDEISAMLDWLKDQIDFEQARQGEPDVWGARLYWGLSQSFFENRASQVSPNP